MHIQLGQKINTCLKSEHDNDHHFNIRIHHYRISDDTSDLVHEVHATLPIIKKKKTGKREKRESGRKKEKGGWNEERKEIFCET